MAAVVILGTAGIVYSRDQRQPDNTRPFAAAPGRPADHWHAAIGYYICGTFVPNLPEGEDPLGIHGHGDNVVHIHPFVNSSAGKRATLEVYFDTVGADISDDRIELPGQDTKRTGDRCEDGPGRIQTKVWDKRNPDDPGRIIEGDPSAIRPQDNQLITIAFVPEGADIPKPPSTPTLDNLSDVTPPPTASTSSTAPATTTAPDPTASTTSSVPDPNTSPPASTSSTTRVP
ncbi:MAG: hypothetical protein AVDCRST_MAG10-3776 [uncultured Acidimicrobiales bacterium]|uniref:Uncharacterized protein n=1 Tax=uncultured Acidimicrobiales bacterium TaxID=310071 RepID=A0A6J4JG15_9ACTN|nr:MAG: hypothetical protein AVDCRST_MAG10-3776 [uncultured Acidimicrobiales bacterium]